MVTVLFHYINWFSIIYLISYQKFLYRIPSYTNNYIYIYYTHKMPLQQLPN